MNICWFLLPSLYPDVEFCEKEGVETARTPRTDSMVLMLPGVVTGLDYDLHQPSQPYMETRSSLNHVSGQPTWFPGEETHKILLSTSAVETVVLLEIR